MVEWSPDGGKLCYVSDTIICIKDASGKGKPVQIGNQAVARLGSIGALGKNSLNHYLALSWSPDGGYIVFVEMKAVGLTKPYEISLCVANADGTGQTVLMSDSGVLMMNPAWAP
ncbi:MAG: TolB family protein [Bacteroidota bacterium]